MKNILNKQWYILLSVGLMLACCKNDDDEGCDDPTNSACENYDPCYGENPTSADFTISGQLAGGGPHATTYIEDDVFVGRSLKFSAVDKDAASYRWYLGVDTFQNVTEKTLSIDDLEYGTYYAALVVEKDPNLNCFPSDTGRDSVYKEFTFIHWCDVLFRGTFRGVWDEAPNDSAEVTLEFSDIYFQEGPCGGSILQSINLSMEGDTVATFAQAFVNTYVVFGGSGSASPQGYAEVNKQTLEVYMEYEYLSENFKFRGKKIE